MSHTVTTLERLAVIEQQLKQGNSENQEIKKVLERLDKKIDTLTNYYAGKWVEKVLIGTIGGLLTAILITIIRLGVN